ncbi:MAG: hypothetical protein EBS73_17295 [Betaproteobacteria bacterium]|nr:hypothetical protein [Betaproteobacteria bacterium]NBS40963.1 hypothetical protein [Betaproteobacteria bacterium]
MAEDAPIILRFILRSNGDIVDCMILSAMPLELNKHKHFTHVDQLPLYIQEKLAVLMALDPHERAVKGDEDDHVRGIGRRLGMNTYWVYLDDDDGIYTGSEG